MNPLLSHYICIESDFFQELGEKNWRNFRKTGPFYPNLGNSSSLTFHVKRDELVRSRS